MGKNLAAEGVGGLRLCLILLEVGLRLVVGWLRLQRGLSVGEAAHFCWPLARGCHYSGYYLGVVTFGYYFGHYVWPCTLAIILTVTLPIILATALVFTRPGAAGIVR